MLSFTVIDRPGPIQDHSPPSRAGPHLGFEALHIIKTHPLVALEGIGHLLVHDSALSGPLPGADLLGAEGRAGEKAGAPQEPRGD